MGTTLTFLCALLAAQILSSDAQHQVGFAGRHLLLDSSPASQIIPVPPSVGAEVPLTYFGPSPSQVLKELVGPYQLLKSGTIDQDALTITLPLYRGIDDSTQGTYWYIATDTNDQANAAALGINFSSKLTYSVDDNSTAVRQAYQGADQVIHTANGRVDFSPVRSILPGDAPNYFPPKKYSYGSIGLDGYSPLMQVGGYIYNAPIVAGNTPIEQLSMYCVTKPTGPLNMTGAYDVLHNRVWSICPVGNGGTVTMQLVPGFSFGKPILYLTTDASDELAAALEAATFAPALGAIPVGGDDSLFSAVERIFHVVNGYTNKDVNPLNLTNGLNETVHPSRQGFNSAIIDGGSPMGVLGGIPTVATDYSPLWDLNLGMWTPYSVASGYRVRWLDEFQILGFAQHGYVTGPDGTPFGSVGIIINCPIAHRFL